LNGVFWNGRGIFTSCSSEEGRSFFPVCVDPLEEELKAVALMAEVEIGTGQQLSHLRGEAYETSVGFGYAPCCVVIRHGGGWVHCGDVFVRPDVVAIRG